ncbi:6-phospho-3-hexuloisomerase [Lactobacillus sp. ESL0261]|uniref:6-phospho-3-hexuloisomerase n=1 Tax=Lactobacillus sp. ESL0261 TaxID=2069348 RepID=UPI000EFB277B|nr:6-phospho-3-hexuloisomerase [Lactobacillus sp. ESL0261]RMC56914.1 SIS domain-containing protein [Lactobacillus sp. ESL0261]
MIDEFDQIINELGNIHCDLTNEKADQILRMFLNAKSIFLSGEGRSGLMINALANRLTQFGLRVHLVTEITAPAIGKDDLLIFNSASGKSSTLISQEESAKRAKAKIIVFTANKKAPLNQKCDVAVLIEAQDKDTTGSSIQPMGSLYEQSSLLLFDSLVLRALHTNLITVSQLRSVHSNLE